MSKGIYIFANKALKDYVRIGYADDIDATLKRLNDSNASPEPFILYASYHIDNLPCYTSRNVHPLNFTNHDEVSCTLKPEAVYSVFEALAKLSGTELCLVRENPALDLGQYNAVYNGRFFRSENDAEWATFFDAMGIEWEYMPEEFLLPDGQHYIPEFKLHNFITGDNESCKGKILWAKTLDISDRDEMMPEDFDKAKAFCNGCTNDIIFLPSLKNEKLMHPEPEKYNCGKWFSSSISTFELIHDDYYPCVIIKDNPYGKRFKLQGGDYISKKNERITNEALEKAADMHFECLK